MSFVSLRNLQLNSLRLLYTEESIWEKKQESERESDTDGEFKI